MTERREILLVANPGRPDIVRTAARVAKVLRDNGIGMRVLVDEYDTTKLDSPPDLGGLMPEAAGVTVVEFGPEAARGCEMVLVLGGDGTLLRAAELARSAGIPVLGVNLGRIGFLAEAEADDLDDVLDRVVRRDYRVESRMTLDVTVSVGDDVVERGWALNEASVENSSRLGVLEIVLEVDGRPVSSFGCDGVLLSTPTGSTAYAFSAGGPVMWPQLEAILVIPSNAHALFARPLVTSPESHIALEVFDGGHDALVFCDGRRTMDLPAGARLDVVRGAKPVQWVKLDSTPFADRVVHKFALPVTGWRGRPT